MKTAFNNTRRTYTITFCITYKPRDQHPWLFILVVFHWCLYKETGTL